jgi:glycosyltransferase involved in cell wall biosynthesis
MTKRLLVIQYAGDYREAVRRFATEGSETFYAQRYSVDTIAEIGKQIDEAATLCCLTQEPYNEMLENGVRGIGTGFKQAVDPRKLIQIVEDYDPTHLVIRTPIREVLRWAIQNNIKTLMMLADSFPTNGLRHKIRNYRRSRLLNHKQIDWVGNNNTPASISLAKSGVRPEKIIPWEWPHATTPESFAAKTFPVKNDAPWQIVFVGALKQAKGVGDAIEAIAQLKSQGLAIHLKVAGRGTIDGFASQAQQLGVADCVEFLGLVPNHTIIPLMHEADFVLVPSRREYPEGFPKALVEAICSRTPIIASDHPMFCRKLKHESSALIFPGSTPKAIAACIERLISDPELYERLSLAAEETWDNLQIPVLWGELIKRWIFDSPANQQWIFDNRLSSGKYPDW